MPICSKVSEALSDMTHEYEKILVTGGAGFIGSHLVDRLMAEDFDVAVLDNLSTGHLGNLSQHESNGAFRFVKGDIRDVASVKKAMQDVDAVFHEAALVSVTDSVQTPILTNDVNVGGTLTLLKASCDLDVKRFIFASSAAVYGNAKSPVKEDATLPNPTSLYGGSKLAAETYVRVFDRVYGLETVSLRYFNVYGPRQSFDMQGAYGGAVAIFTSRLLNGLPPTIYGDGNQTRDFVYIKDVVDASVLALRNKEAAGEAFNIASGEKTSVNLVADLLKKLLNQTDLRNVHADPRPTDIRHSYADITKAKNILGYQPKFALKGGLKALVKWDSQRRHAPGDAVFQVP